ncbi:MSMEG_1061 family FMN-dependent PPOX-type flavoprotein [Conexibacter woesei]|uniref:Pyridoxamine 5'-phosphate oxidase-related FMN-binding protein n=1 Tax=Conexibacter woesei (strain DSM 14684 / CCUG 47730 / CIP 108061 / JCM 11494 / NBRC 100937 / ID131577) TaxID=469383 RepID=D3EZC2_CONWI|nr:MSMEG_1061 family FMN-dependent PPOX-type flavoprotein [Conexibacter woesei]ADB51887.1 pyridoxamine 5'-phosphate oxidase-related FMN- binding protein [Conexibacter woesei DSM 14684]
MTAGPFDGALGSEAELHELYEQVDERAVRKQIDRIDPMARRLIAVAPIAFVASHDAAGRTDVSPRGGPPGFVSVLDDHHLALPDATGNRRLDTLRNVIETGHAAVIFVIPGRAQALRVNGPARVSARPDLLDRLTPVGKPPRSAIVVEAAEVYAHCPKAFVRSRVWSPDSWPAAADLPTPAEVSHAHMGGDAFMTLDQVQQAAEDSLRYRLA